MAFNILKAISSQLLELVINMVINFFATLFAKIIVYGIWELASFLLKLVWTKMVEYYNSAPAANNPHNRNIHGDRRVFRNVTVRHGNHYVQLDTGRVIDVNNGPVYQGRYG
ncbi:hypothetical protein F5B20DRAFT_584291 [Whalleya microplaca]|nr:hypothetical protein F5B20DRAFT_584291 [Whalleya microplaca]